MVTVTSVEIRLTPTFLITCMQHIVHIAHRLLIYCSDILNKHYITYLYLYFQFIFIIG